MRETDLAYFAAYVSVTKFSFSSRQLLDSPEIRHINYFYVKSCLWRYRRRLSTVVAWSILVVNEISPLLQLARPSPIDHIKTRSRQRPPAHQDGSSPPQERSLTFVVKRTPDIPSNIIQPDNPQTKQGLKLCPCCPRYPRPWPFCHRHHSQRPPSTRITSQELGCSAGTVEARVGKAFRRNRGSGSHWHGEDDCQQCTPPTSPLLLAVERS